MNGLKAIVDMPEINAKILSILGAKTDMATSLYDLSVGCFLQTVGAVVGFLERGRVHCEEVGTDPDELVEVRLFPDMAPLRFQIVAVAHHSIGAIEGIERGSINSRPAAHQPRDYAGLQKIATNTEAALQALTPAAVHALDGKEVALQSGERTIPFTAGNFVLSFSLPNFHFHSTTAYDILRVQGVPLGKRNYLGRLLTKA
ncbi:DUF1993 domain-containing protein [Phenylobacterium sp.]|uniref:DUF1993 domain-containing protein n=1 Tax=Phenylobacterium sp. TaxID=1871053 RepID=UPI002E32158B|nr:DUF1993 domain-containing protein [Phenylobacterium sp.]HEX3365679.1 DUF1993 domain-containing protein [Phenylobacterium sp.]